MNSFAKVGLAIAAATLTSVSTMSGALAGGWLDRGAGALRGSLKDGPGIQHRGGVNRCYVRADVGYSVSGEPVVNWPVTSYDAGTGSFVYLGHGVANETMDNGWVGEFGGGCGSGSRGLRGDVTFGYRGKRGVDGEPHEYVPGPGGPPIDDPLHTAVTNYTVMFNAYYDFGKWHNFVPYVGAGIGVAYNEVEEVYFTGNPFLVNRIQGNADIDLAWQLSAGAAYQISDRAVLDMGYRFIHLGDARSGRVDSARFVNPRVRISDIHAHEFKVGLRYHLPN